MLCLKNKAFFSPRSRRSHVFVPVRFMRSSFVVFKTAQKSYIPRTSFIQLRKYREIVRIEYGVSGPGSQKAGGHFCITDLTPGEIQILAQGGIIKKNDCLVVATHSQITDGVPNVLISYRDLKKNSTEQYALNEFSTCLIKRIGSNTYTFQDTLNQLISAHKQAAENLKNLGIGKIIP